MSVWYPRSPALALKNAMIEPSSMIETRCLPSCAFNYAYDNIYFKVFCTPSGQSREISAGEPASASAIQIKCGNVFATCILV
jgi:hypothetical protein